MMVFWNQKQLILYNIYIGCYLLSCSIYALGNFLRQIDFFIFFFFLLNLKSFLFFVAFIPLRYTCRPHMNVFGLWEGAGESGENPWTFLAVR